MSIDEPTLQVQSADAQNANFVVCVGDSRTASFVGLFGGVPMVNLAIPGQTAAQIFSSQLPTLAELWQQGNALGLYIDAGTNDLPLLQAGTETWAQFTTTATSIISCALAAGFPANKIAVSQVAPLSGNPTAFPYSQGMQATWSSICQPEGIDGISLIELFTNGGETVDTIDPTYYVADGVHYSTKAHKNLLLPVQQQLVTAWD